ncbi:hypothetical protein ABBQ32_006639 [Trebouxia sp. C0010 RCD-2024]
MALMRASDTSDSLQREIYTLKGLLESVVNLHAPCTQLPNRASAPGRSIHDAANEAVCDDQVSRPPAASPQMRQPPATLVYKHKRSNRTSIISVKGGH